jgi:hypothetical protein
MTTGNDDNCKLPKDAVSKGDIEMKYGFVNGEVRECGYVKLIYNNEEEQDKTTEIKIHPTGDHEVTESNSKKKSIRLSAHTGEHRQYTGGGSSTQVDGHFDHNSASTSRFESGGDMAHATGKNKILGIKGQHHKIIGGGEAKILSGSAPVQASGWSGTVRNSYEKDFFNHIQGDHVTMGEKNWVQVTQKDVSSYAGSNWDTYVKEKGKLETGDKLLIQTGDDATINSAADVIITSKANITITADTKITIKVGSNKIEISSSGITIDAGSGKVDITATGDVKTKGATTKIQNGGVSAPPTTFT